MGYLSRMHVKQLNYKGEPMIMLTEAEANEIRALLIQLSREILLQGTYQRKIASCLVILSKHPQ
jgi:hypothetical protein